MITIETVANSNTYVQKNIDSAICQMLKRINIDKDITFIQVLQGYPLTTVTSDIDIFVLLSASQIKALSNNNTTYFIYNGELEGYNSFVYFDILYNNCKKYNIPPQKIIYINSSQDIQFISNIYNKQHNILPHNSIHIYSIMGFLVSAYLRITWEKEEKLSDNTIEGIVSNYKEKIHNLYNRKYILSLSRRARTHRNLLHFLIWQSQLLHNKCIISQNTISDKECVCIANLARCCKNHVISWQNTLPILADTADFETNHAGNLNEDLHHSTLFQIIGETYSELSAQAGLFYSEKTFKPIIWMQPFIIAGQPNCNKKLKDYGFKLYDDIFDYSFDSILDTNQRFRAIIKESIRVVKQINMLSKKDQLEWRFKTLDTAIHNFKTLYTCSNEFEKLTTFIELL